MARSFTQREGIDNNEVYSPVVKFRSIRFILSLVAAYDFELEQMDVKMAFLHGELKEKILMSQPEGFKQESKQEMVCLLKKSIYGLKQSPRQWNKRFDVFVQNHLFKKSKYDPCVYLKEFLWRTYWV